MNTKYKRDKMVVVFEHYKPIDKGESLKRLYQLTHQRFDREFLDFVNKYLLESNRVRLPISIYRQDDIKLKPNPLSPNDYWLTDNGLDYDGADPSGFLPYFKRAKNQGDLPF
jgi:hypothetical protein